MLSRFSCVWLFATPWTVAHQTPLSLGFSRQEYWSRFPFPSAGDPNPGIELMSLTSPVLQAGPLPLASPGKPRLDYTAATTNSNFSGLTQQKFTSHCALHPGQVIRGFCSAQERLPSTQAFITYSPRKRKLLSPIMATECKTFSWRQHLTH